MIKVTDEWYLSADEVCVTLSKKGVIQSGKTKGDIHYTAKGYYNNFKDALKAMVNKDIQGLDDIKSMVERLYKLENYIDNVIPDLVKISPVTK